MARYWKSSFVSSGWLMVLVATWAGFAPPQLGGRTSLVVITGESMEPAFHSDDLVIVRQQASYQTGDMVAYKNPELGNNVFHRIIGQHQDRFVLKGDNNTWIDSYEPLPGEVIGGFWIAVPGAGKWIRAVRRPMTMAVIAGALALLFGLGAARERPKGGRMLKKTTFRDWMTEANPFGPRAGVSGARGGTSRDQTASRPISGASIPLPVEAISFGFSLLLFSSVAIGIVGFINPLTKQAAVEVPFQHLGFFTYSAPAPSGVYDAGGLRTGEPIFPSVTCAVDLGFQYTLVSNLPGDTLAGTYRVMAVIAEPMSGWQRLISLRPETTFTGGNFGTHATFNVCQATAMIDEMEAQTGFHPGSYIISLRPEVRLSGTLAGVEVQDAFQPELKFAYARSHLYVMRDDVQSDPLMPAQAGVSRTYRTAPNTVGLLGLDLSVPAMRLAAVMGMLLSVAGFIWLRRYLRQLQVRDPQQFVRAKYAPLLLEIGDVRPLLGSRIAQVAAIDDLAKLAEKNGAMLLHDAADRSSYYVVDAHRCTLGSDEDALEAARSRKDWLP